jgi:hypothetical protein
MFSSCDPISAFVLGVKMGSVNLDDSSKFFGMGISCTVPDLRYSL